MILVFRISFSFASYLTSLSLIEDRIGGVWNRFAVAGVKPHQFLLSHLFSGASLMILQALEFVVYAVYLSFDFSLNFVLLVSMLLIMMGLAGVLFGLTLSVLTDNTLVASFASLLGIYPFVSMSGE